MPNSKGPLYFSCCVRAHHALYSFFFFFLFEILFATLFYLCNLLNPHKANNLAKPKNLKMWRLSTAPGQPHGGPGGQERDDFIVKGTKVLLLLVATILSTPIQVPSMEIKRSRQHTPPAKFVGKRIMLLLNIGIDLIIHISQRYFHKP